MDSNKIVGKVLITARHFPSNQIVISAIIFEDRIDSIYYCWTFSDSNGMLIANKCFADKQKNIDNIKLIDKKFLKYWIFENFE